jgi:hypothetical protein
MKRLLTAAITTSSIAALLVLGASFSGNRGPGSAGFVPTARAQERELAEPGERLGFPRKPYCALGTLQGSFGYTTQGTVLPGAPLPPIISPGPYASSGLVTLDGFGNLTITANDIFNGLVLPTGTIRGTYTVNSDCTGSAVTEVGGQFKFTIVNGGAEILYSLANPGVVATGIAKKL